MSAGCVLQTSCVPAGWVLLYLCVSSLSRTAEEADRQITHRYSSSLVTACQTEREEGGRGVNMVYITAATLLTTPLPCLFPSSSPPLSSLPPLSSFIVFLSCPQLSSHPIPTFALLTSAPAFSLQSRSMSFHTSTDYKNDYTFYSILLKDLYSVYRSLQTA